MSKRNRLLALVLALTMAFALAGCGGSGGSEPAVEETAAPSAEPEPEAEASDESPGVVSEPSAIQLLSGEEWGMDYTSLYERFGRDVSIADVAEDETTGLACLTIDGESYELGLDFLTMAMVYNTSTEGTDFETEDEVYAEWWKYYITRWNYLMPEIPLYSNEYYDVYNADIRGVEQYPTNPFWSPAKALIDWTSRKEDGSFILCGSDDLSGRFRYADFGAAGAAASDRDIESLVVGLETVSVTKEGGFAVNSTVVKKFDRTENDDGSVTFTFRIFDDLVFSDGSPITAKNYLYFPVAFSTPVGAEGSGRDVMAAMRVAGYDEFAAYDGANADQKGVSRVFSGLRLLDDYTFSVTISSAYCPYYYAIAYAGFTPVYKDVWFGAADIADDGEGVYATDDFYAKDGDSYALAAHIADSARNADNTYPYSGPYTVESYDADDGSVVLKRNTKFKGNYEGARPKIKTVVYRGVAEPRLEDLTSGSVDCLAAITGGAEISEALAMVDASDGAFVCTHYTRAGYGKLGFRADFGPVQYTEVRQAVALCLDRDAFAADMTGGYGCAVDGPYSADAWMYKAAVGRGMQLDAYDTSVDSAVALLEAAGWVYDAEGGAYTEGVRYKRIAGGDATGYDRSYQSVDGEYKTVEIDGDYYMPLVLNWFGIEDNAFSNQLVTGFEKNARLAAAGFAVCRTVGSFEQMLDELYQQMVNGTYGGAPMYNCFNFATACDSAIYDCSWYMTIDPDMYDDYSEYYLKDAADIYWFS